MLNHTGTVELTTERLKLRRFTTADAQDMFNNWANDAEVTKYLMWPPHASVEVTRSILDEWTKNYADEKYYQWAIVPKDNNDEPIGSISVVEMKERVASFHIGYCIGRKWWRQGVTSEALKAVIDFLFAEVGAERVDARHDPRNPNSGRVMQKCGMKYEGTLRRYDWNNQGVCDASYYSILRDEWRKSWLDRCKG